MLYARDLIAGGHRDRLFTRLDEPWAPEDLWWLSVDGIYRPREDRGGERAACLRLLPAARRASSAPARGNPVAWLARPGGWANAQTTWLTGLIGLIGPAGLPTALIRAPRYSRAKMSRAAWRPDSRPAARSLGSVVSRLTGGTDGGG